MTWKLAEPKTRTAPKTKPNASREAIKCAIFSCENAMVAANKWIHENRKVHTYDIVSVSVVYVRVYYKEIAA